MLLTSRRRFAILLTLLAALAAVAIACGDDDDSGPSESAAGSPTASPSADEPTSTRGGESPTDGETPAPSFNENYIDILDAAVLGDSDVPTGLIALGSTISTNQDVADANPDPAAQLAQLEEWERLLGLELAYQPGPVASPDILILSLTSGASLYGSPEGASASYQSAVQEAEGIDWQLQYSNLEDVQVQTLDTASLGSDEAYWVRISGIQDATTTSIDDYVLMRSGVLRLFLRTVSFGPADGGRDDNIDTVQALAQLQVQRAGEAMAGQ